MRIAVSTRHPFSTPLELDPWLKRCLDASIALGPKISAYRLRRLEHWSRIAAECSGERESWLRGLPAHCQQLYCHSGLNGPLLRRMHQYMVSLGYPDTTLFSDLSQGFQSGGVLPDTGLWPANPVAEELVSKLLPIPEAYKQAPHFLEQWRQTRRPDKASAFLLERNDAEVAKKRREPVQIESLVPGSFVAHPEFTIVQKGKPRACDDLSVSLWNSTQCSREKLTLPGTDDPLAYATCLHMFMPNAEPQVAVADENEAYRNYATREPSAMVMLVFLRDVVKAWRDFALPFGDYGAVFAYNRVRSMISFFMMLEFLIATWAYYDDTCMVEPRHSAFNGWFTFLQVHKWLGIPIKGNPLQVEGRARDTSKFFSPSGSNPFLGEQVQTGSLPCSAGPTKTRMQNIRELIAGVFADDALPPGRASSVFGKCRFLASDLHGRVGFPALQAISARQNQRSAKLTPLLKTSLQFLCDISDEVGPRVWPFGVPIASELHVFGDASEPHASSGLSCRMGAIMISSGTGASRYWECDVPLRVLKAFQRRHCIYLLESLWPAACALAWKDCLHNSHPVFYDDNRGAEFSLLKGFSPDVAASLILALFWSASAVQKSRPWVTRVASADNPADCLTKPGPDRSHLDAALADHVDLQPVWDILCDSLENGSFPAWSALSAPFRPSVQ